MSLSLKDVIGVNRKHSLNRGRVAWWLCLPRTMGGRQWYDLMGRNHGTLTNMTTSASGWRGTTRPGGGGHLLFDGSNDAVAVNNSNSLNPGTGNFSVACWYRGLNANRNYVIYAKAGSGDVRLVLSQGRYYAGTTSRQIGLSVYDSALDQGQAVYTTASVVDGLWHHIAAVYVVNSTPLIYVDGVAQATSADLNTAWIDVSNDTDVTIGATATLFSPMSSPADDVSYYSRALSAAKVRSLYNLSRAGYPGVLLREGDDVF